MTDAPFTETHRATLETFVMSSQHKLLNELQAQQLDAIDAALKEIDRLTAQYGEVVVEAAKRLAIRQEEIDRLTRSLREVRERKDQRITELVQKLTSTRLALGDANAEIARLQAAHGEARAALETLADDYEQLCGDGVTEDTQPGVLRDARDVLARTP